MASAARYIPWKDESESSPPRDALHGYAGAVNEHSFDAQLWRWTSNGVAWVFLTLPENIADQIEAQQVGPGRGFGAVKVRVTIGSSTWDTSMFPSRKHASYILPVKAPVRRQEGLDAGDTASVSILLIAV